MKEYDVIVVGAGNAGLMAAANTTKAGLKTLVLEKHNLPGGSATSFKRGRFEFEAALHEFAGWSSTYKRMFSAVDIELDMIELDETFRVIVTGEDGYDVTMPKGRVEFIKKMEEEVPGSTESMERFFDLAEEIMRAIKYFASTNGNPNKLTMVKDYKNFLKIADYSALEVMEELEIPEKAIRILSSYWTYIGMPMPTFGAILYLLMIGFYVEDGACIPRLRSHEMSLAIEKAIFKNGGDIWYNTKVDEILVKDGKAYGVKTRHGEIYAKQVICNIFPRFVYGNMMDKKEVPDRALKLENAREISGSAFTMYLGLNRSPEELGIEDYTLFMYPSTDTEKVFKDMYHIEKNYMTAMNCVNIGNPECSPEGTTMLWATQLHYGDAWDHITPEEYEKKKIETAERIIRQYEETSGNIITPYIEEIEIGAPPTFARYLGTPNGSIYGYQGQKWDTLMSRTLADKQERWIENLKFCGGFHTQMNGFSSAYRTGNAVGREVAAELKGVK